LLIEWGYCKEPKSSTFVDFPLSFDICLSLLLTNKSDSTSNAISITVLTSTQFRWKAGSAWDNDYAYWIAVGY